MMADASAKTSYMLVDFTDATATNRFTDWNVDLGGGRISIPSFDIKIPPNSATIDEGVLSIEFAFGENAYLDSLVDGTIISATRAQLTMVTLEQAPLDPNGTQNTYLGKWRLLRGIKNPQRRLGVGRLEFVSLKTLATVPLGIPATPKCAWAFKDPTTCQLVFDTDTDPWTHASPGGLTPGANMSGDVSVTVLSIVGKVMTVSGNLASNGFDIFHRGYVEKDGVRIEIREHDGSNPSVSSYSVGLVREPPSDWVSQTVNIRPGCDKTLDSCRNRWGNEERFCGLGIAIPAYHPVFEVP